MANDDITNNTDSILRTLNSNNAAAEMSHENFQAGVDLQFQRIDAEQPPCCPYCGALMDAGADFCEACHRYVMSNICSYCGTQLEGEETYCSECGNPRGGLVCPVCHSMNDFAFCKQCGTPLTGEAMSMQAEMMSHQDYMELKSAVEQLANLENCLPYTSERDVLCQEMNEKLRERVLKLLAKDRGSHNVEIKPLPATRMHSEQLNEKKELAMDKIAELLDKMALIKAESPVKARNYCMATKPAGIRLAWVCNYKHAMHSSPCGCAKPHLGGKWIILGRGTKVDINDDN